MKVYELVNNYNEGCAKISEGCAKVGDAFMGAELFDILAVFVSICVIVFMWFGAVWLSSFIRKCICELKKENKEEGY